MGWIRMSCLCLVAFAIFFTSGKAFAQPPAGAPQDDIWANFESLDANKDGKVDVDEFLTRQRNRFQSYDLDKDWAITKEEIMQARKRLHERIRKGPMGGGDQ